MRCPGRFKLKTLIWILVISVFLLVLVVLEGSVRVKGKTRADGSHRNGRKVASISAEMIEPLPVNPFYDGGGKFFPHQGLRENGGNSWADFNKASSKIPQWTSSVNENGLMHIEKKLTKKREGDGYGEIKTQQENTVQYKRSGNNSGNVVYGHRNTKTLKNAESQKVSTNSFEVLSSKESQTLQSNALHAMWLNPLETKRSGKTKNNESRSLQTIHLPKEEINLIEQIAKATDSDAIKLTRNSYQDLPVRDARFLSSSVLNAMKSYSGIKKMDANKNLLNKKRGYETRVVIENVTIPSNWTASPDLSSRLRKRKDHVREVCHRRGLDVQTKINTPNVWEFLINDKYHLIWCNVFKAASSTWFYNFNLLAGYSELELMKTKDTPIAMARKKYERPSLQKVEDSLYHSNGSYLSFMIARHPLDRLVSAFRDKLENGERFYRQLAKTIVETYPNLPKGKKVEQQSPVYNVRNRHRRNYVYNYQPPSFEQFVQFILDQHERGEKLNEHWASLNSFCTPCLIDFDVYAKVETLQEDGNYIIFTSGIENVIKPKLINKSKNGPTANVTKDYMCRLSPAQQKGLVNIYKLDMDLFEYGYEEYFKCGNS